MSRRRRRGASTSQPEAGAAPLRGRLVLCAAAFVVVAATAVGAYFWPDFRPTTGTPPPPLVDASVSIELPTAPEALAVDELRAEAIQAVKQLTERYPASAAAHRTAASLYQFLKQYDAATGHWERCIALDPARAEARASLAQVQLLQGQDSQARQTLTAAMEAGLGTADIYRQLAEALQRTGELEKAEDLAQEGLEKFPASTDLWVSLGQTQLQLGHLDDAKTSIDTALRHQPRSGTAHFAAANIYVRLGASDEAEKHRRLVEKMKAGQPGKRRTFEEDYEATLREVVSPLYSAIALLYDTQGQPADAEHWCRRAIALVPSAPDPLRLLVNIYRSRGQIGNAHVVQRRLAELEPANVVNHINLANLALALGRLDDGERALLDAARIAPRNALVRRMLAAVLVERGELAQAREAAQQAVQLEPSADGYELLAAICRQQGDLDAGAAADRAATDLQSTASPRGKPSE